MEARILELNFVDAALYERGDLAMECVVTSGGESAFMLFYLLPSSFSLLLHFVSLYKLTSTHHDFLAHCPIGGGLQWNLE